MNRPQSPRALPVNQLDNGVDGIFQRSAHGHRSQFVHTLDKRSMKSADPLHGFERRPKSLTGFEFETTSKLNYVLDFSRIYSP